MSGGVYGGGRYFISLTLDFSPVSQTVYNFSFMSAYVK